ncbi:mob kinase activator-like [Anaeramoeba flamelloides]|uniref:Mob kinase activator-like n=1 Tax=Anaeramoeba flamelloides TaxID=1746091 RepID=A0AAV7ZLW2_9EUKA|nr:mob kinase activator-like [Anaeramoeba flamelloides]
MNKFEKSSIFIPKRKVRDKEKQRELLEYTENISGHQNLRKTVRLPEGESINEWLACNTVDFYNQINMIFGTINLYCDSQTCPSMTAGSKYEYLWATIVNEQRQFKKVSASEYIKNLMDWIQSLLDDEKTFSSKNDIPFPKNFYDIIKDIFKRLFRVYAHIFYHHYSLIMQLGFNEEFNMSFKHFIFFVEEFELMSVTEIQPLQELISSLLPKKKKKKKKKKRRSRSGKIKNTEEK